MRPGTLPPPPAPWAYVEPVMSEPMLLRAYGCPCHRPNEERHTLAEWDAIEARQRAFAADPGLVDAEGREIAALLNAREGEKRYNRPVGISDANTATMGDARSSADTSRAGVLRLAVSAP